MSQPPVRRRVPAKLDDPERMRVVRENHGFFPVVQEELTRAIGTITFLESPRKSAQYLSEIYIHQMKNKSKYPEATIARVVKKCANFAVQASQDADILKRFHALAAEEYMNPSVTLSEEAAGEPAVSRIVRFVDLRTFTNVGSVGSQDFRPLGSKFGVVGSLSHGLFFDQYTHLRPSAAVADRIDTVATATTVKDLRTLVPEAISDQDARFAFWHNRLEEFLTYDVAHEAAEAVLARFEK